MTPRIHRQNLRDLIKTVRGPYKNGQGTLFRKIPDEYLREILVLEAALLGDESLRQGSLQSADRSWPIRTAYTPPNTRVSERYGDQDHTLQHCNS